MEVRPIKLRFICLAACALWILVAAEAEAQEEYLQLRGAVHIHSKFSTGRETIEEIANRAVEHGLDFLVISDDDLLKVEYGPPLLRNLALGVDTTALFTSGTLDEYFAEIRRVDALYPNLIAIEGVESAPFYYWTVDLGKRLWTVHNWDKHLLAVGLDSLESYAKLPVIGGEGVAVWHWTSVLLLWPLLGLLYALAVGRGHPRAVRWLVGVVSVLCLVNNAPFKTALVDAYSGNLGAAPYQYYIDYVNDHGGLAFWAHPAARSPLRPRSLLGGLVHTMTVTRSHPEDLLETRDYAGFAAISGEGMKFTEPGGIWDQVLAEYIEGKRRRPAWGYGEIDYHFDNAEDPIDDKLTVVLARQATRQDVLEALRRGRTYAVWGGDEHLALKRFSAATGSARAIVSEHIETSGEVTVFVDIDKLNGVGERIRLRLIKAGAIVADINAETPLEFRHVDAGIRPGEHTYYRLIATGPKTRLTSNPIFITGGEQ